MGAARWGEATGGVAGVGDEVALLGLADMPPPAIMSAFAQPAPVSSVTWQVTRLACKAPCLNVETIYD